jgi:REP element-mobilizing transposase RayT
MPQSYVSCDLHCVFSTKDRAPVLNAEMRDKLFRFFGGVAHKFRMHLYTAGGIEDHIHLLIAIPATLTISEALKIFKGSSSHWVHETYSDMAGFAWQEGYGAFSVSRSQRSRTVAYIENQVQHHQGITFDDELNAILRKHELFKPPES